MTAPDERIPFVLLESVSEGMAALETDGTINFCNTAFGRLAGSSPENLTGGRFQDLLAPEEGEMFAGLLEDPEGEAVSRVFHLNGSGETARPVRLSLGRLEAGGLDGWVVLVTDHSGSEQLYRAMIESGSDLITLLDAEGKIRYASPSVERILGYEQEELYGASAFDYVHQSDQKNTLRIFSDAVRSRAPNRPVKFRFRHKDGSWRILEGAGGALEDAEEVTVLLNVRDITDLRRQTHQIRELARFPDENPNPVMRITSAGVLVYANGSSRELLSGLSTGIGEPLPEPLREFGLDAYERAETMTHQVYSGGKIWELVFSPVTRENYINLYGYDITARLESERQIRFQADLLDQVGQAVMSADRGGVITYLNRAARALFGWKEKDAVGRSINEIIPASYSTSQTLEIMRTLAAGKVWRGERRVRPSRGDEIPVEVAYSPIHDLAGNQVGTIGIAYDITERKRVEADVRDRSEELARLFAFSRSLAAADDLEEALLLCSRRAVELTHSTYAAVALLENDQMVLRAVKPIRLLEKELKLGRSRAITDLPNFSRVLLGDEPVVFRVEDARLTREEREMFLPGQIVTLCLVPLSVGRPRSGTRQPLGMLVIGEARNPEREPFGEQKLRMTRSIGDQAAVAIRRLLLKEQTRRHVLQLAALAEIDRAIIAGLDLERTLTVILEQIRLHLEVSAACVLLMNPATRTLEYVQGSGFLTDIIEKSVLPLKSGIAGSAVIERQMKVVNLAEAGDQTGRSALLAAEDFAVYVVVPLLTKDQVKGVLEVFHRRPMRPNPEWLDFLNTLAGQTAIAIDNSQLFRDLQHSLIELASAYDATISGWSHAMDLRDRETEGHTQRVTEMSMLLAREMGFKADELAHIRRGALLHDIGKMGVSDAVLLKPGAFTPEEREEMERHPQFAYDMLSPIAFLEPALDIPYCHHERWDGTGYPRGLEGEQIPRSARLFAVVDVWDALRSDRPYRDAWSYEAAREHILKGAGSHFDPDVVETFITMLDRGEFDSQLRSARGED